MEKELLEKLIRKIELDLAAERLALENEADNRFIYRRQGAVNKLSELLEFYKGWKDGTLDKQQAEEDAGA